MSKDVVVLIHGIRTEAAWAEMVAAVLENSNVQVIPIRYGYFDVFRFWSPIFTRAAVVRRITRELRDIRSHYPSDRISVIAHSFGTYAITKALEQHDIKLHRLILCGSIVRNDFRRAAHSAQLSDDPIINDCGTHDIWPAMAKSTTWGYGSTGSFGFGTVGIFDRFHRYSHSQYFNREFVEKYWKPFIERGEIVQTRDELDRRSPPYWQSLMGALPLKYVPFILMLIVLYRSMFPADIYDLRVMNMHANHWIGVPLIASHLAIRNNTFSPIDVSSLTMTLEGPDGQIHHLTQEAPLQLGFNYLNPVVLQVPAKAEFFQDYTFAGNTSEIAEIANRGYEILTRHIEHANNPIPTAEIYDREFSSQIFEKFNEQNIWTPGAWKYSIRMYINREYREINGAFELTPDRASYLKRITRYYSSGIGVIYAWRTRISATEQTWVAVNPMTGGTIQADLPTRSW